MGAAAEKKTRRVCSSDGTVCRRIKRYRGFYLVVVQGFGHAKWRLADRSLTKLPCWLPAIRSGRVCRNPIGSRRFAVILGLVNRLPHPQVRRSRQPGRAKNNRRLARRGQTSSLLLPKVTAPMTSGSSASLLFVPQANPRRKFSRFSSAACRTTT